jgi:hypothetical protein
MTEYSYTSTPPMGRTACTEPQCLHKGALKKYIQRIYMYVYIYMYVCVYIYIYIYIYGLKNLFEHSGLEKKLPPAGVRTLSLQRPYLLAWDLPMCIEHKT